MHPSDADDGDDGGSSEPWEHCLPTWRRWSSGHDAASCSSAGGAAACTSRDDDADERPDELLHDGSAACDVPSWPCDPSDDADDVRPPCGPDAGDASGPGSSGPSDADGVPAWPHDDGSCDHGVDHGACAANDESDAEPDVASWGEPSGASCVPSMDSFFCVWRPCVPCAS